MTMAGKESYFSHVKKGVRFFAASATKIDRIVCVCEEREEPKGPADQELTETVKRNRGKIYFRSLNFVISKFSVDK